MAVSVKQKPHKLCARAIGLSAELWHSTRYVYVANRERQAINIVCLNRQKKLKQLDAGRRGKKWLNSSCDRNEGTYRSGEGAGKRSDVPSR